MNTDNVIPAWRLENLRWAREIQKIWKQAAEDNDIEFVEFPSVFPDDGKPAA